MRWTRLKVTSLESLLPSTRDVSSVTLAAFLLPAGRLRPRRSSFSRRHRPPFFDFALWTWLCYTSSHFPILLDMRRYKMWIMIDHLFSYSSNNAGLIEPQKMKNMFRFDKSLKSKSIKLKCVNSLHFECSLSLLLHGPSSFFCHL